jgi:2-polyprenyl-3-methyl-5-hydroxy-6-metoxy-1,4-benzoquinol methylase
MAISPVSEKFSNLPHAERLAAVREFWERHVHDWKVARHPPGTREFFEEIEAYRFEKLHYLPRVVDFNAYHGKRLLDVGCGVANDLSRFAKGGAQVTGIDLAPHAIELAQTNFRQRGLAGEFAVMNGEHMQFPDSSFDVVYCHTVLHFTPQPQRMVQEIHRVLKPGGQAILMTVNKKSWLYRLQKLMKVEIDHLESPVYYQFTSTEFRRLLAPFRTVNIVPERFPVTTKVHSGLKALVYNGLFVGSFNILPRSLTRPLGHHLLAFCTK